MEEEWKEIVGFENKYKISNFGRVYSYTAKRILDLTVTKQGYIGVDLYKESKRTRMLAHRLVAIHFLKNTKNKPTVNHKDGIKTNNHIDNLEWATQSEQNKHAFSLGLNKTNFEQLEKNRKKIIERASKAVCGYVEGKLVFEFSCVREAERILKICRSNLSKCCSKRQNYNSCGKLEGKPIVWKYKKDT